MDTPQARVEFLQNLVGKEFTESPSPFGTWLKGKIVAAESDSLTVSFIVRKEMTNPFGILHGGMTAAMIDEVMGILCFTLSTEQYYPTVNLSIDYFASAKTQDTVIVTAKVVRKGKTIVNLFATLTNDKGKILAQATSNLIAQNI
jgi:acyl-coenzyme A thioesterase 13